MQSWDERLSFKGAPLWKEYIKGRISIVCYVHTSACGNCLKSATGTHAKHYVAEGILVIVMCTDTSNLGDSDCRDQSVLVHYIELVEGLEEGTPFFVWLYDIDSQVANILPRYSYFSAIYGCYKFLPRVAERKVCVFGGSSTCVTDDVASHDIKGGSQVVNCVTKHKRNVVWQRLRVQREHVLPGKISIDMKSVEISFKERDKAKFSSLLWRFGRSDFNFGPENTKTSNE